MNDLWLFKLFNCSIILLIFANAWLTKIRCRTWINPGSIFSGFWVIYTGIPFIVAWDVPINVYATSYIFIFCLFFSSTTYFFNWKIAFLKNKNKQSASFYFDRSITNWMLYLFIILSIVFSFINILIQGISINDFIDNPVAIGGIYAGKRYSSELTLNVISQLALQFSYFSVFLGGLIYGARMYSKKQRKVIILCFLPALFIMIFQSSKGLLFFSLFLFFGGILVCKIYNKNYHLISYSEFKKIFIFSCLLLPLVSISFVSRGLYQLEDSWLILDRLRSYFTSYSSVHLPAFADWFSARYFNTSLLNYKQEYYTGGYYTFMSFFNIIGFKKDLPMGVYDEFYEYGNYLKGNLYTIYRGLISDFSVIGSFLFAIIVGFLCNLAFWRLLNKEKSAFAITFFIFFIAISYQTYAISTLTWVTIPVVFLSLWVMLHFFMRIKIS